MLGVSEGSDRREVMKWIIAALVTVYLVAGMTGLVWMRAQEHARERTGICVASGDCAGQDAATGVAAG